MKNRVTSILFAFFLIFISFNGQSQNGAEFLFEVLNSKEKVIETFLIQTDGYNIRWESQSLEKGMQSPSSTNMIFRADQQALIVIDPDNESYQVIDEKAIAQMQQVAASSFKQVEEAMKNLPPEVKAKMEAMQKEGQLSGVSLPGISQTTVSVPQMSSEQTGKTATKLGYSCQQVNVLENGEPVEELWITPWSKVEGGKTLNTSMKKMESFMQKLQAAFPGDFQQNSPLFDGIDQWGGFPVLIVDAESGNVSRLKSAQQKAINAQSFKAPASYKLQSMMPH